jgi:tetratricopeptide (TPR) repeat protein
MIGYRLQRLVIAAVATGYQALAFGQATRGLEQGSKPSEQSHFQQLETFYLSSLQESEKQATEDLRVARWLNGLGSLYLDQGRYREAEPLFRRALSIQQKQFGPGHPEVAISLNNLALKGSTPNRRISIGRLFLSERRFWDPLTKT